MGELDLLESLLVILVTLFTYFVDSNADTEAFPRAVLVLSWWRATGTFQAQTPHKADLISQINSR
jgi:hypothetical protein